MKRTLLIILVFAGVFVCGAVVGGALSIRHFNRFVEDKGANRFAGLQLREMGEKLELTSDQKKKGRVIFERSLKDRQAAQKQMQLITDRMIEDFNALLTPEQREKYKELQSQQKNRERQWQRLFREERERRGGNPPVGPDGKPQPMFPLLEQRRERALERERLQSAPLGGAREGERPPLPPGADGAGAKGEAGAAGSR